MRADGAPPLRRRHGRGSAAARRSRRRSSGASAGASSSQSSSAPRTSTAARGNASAAGPARDRSARPAIRRRRGGDGDGVLGHRCAPARRSQTGSAPPPAKQAGALLHRPLVGGDPAAWVGFESRRRGDRGTAGAPTARRRTVGPFPASARRRCTASRQARLAAGRLAVDADPAPLARRSGSIRRADIDLARGPVSRPNGDAPGGCGLPPAPADGRSRRAGRGAGRGPGASSDSASRTLVLPVPLAPVSTTDCGPSPQRQAVGGSGNRAASAERPRGARPVARHPRRVRSRSSTVTRRVSIDVASDPTPASASGRRWRSRSPSSCRTVGEAASAIEAGAVAARSARRYQADSAN